MRCAGRRQQSLLLLPLLRSDPGGASHQSVGFRRRYPGIDLRLEVGNMAQVAVAMCAGAAELGFVEGSVQDPSLDSAVVAHDQPALAVGDGYPGLVVARCPAGI